MLPPNPADLATEHAAALAEEAELVFEYLAELAHAAATLAEGLAFDAAYLAETAPEGEDRESAEGYYRQAVESAEIAHAYALEVDGMAEVAAGRDAFGRAAEDTEPAALAEVAEAIARSMWRALDALSKETPL